MSRHKAPNSQAASHATRSFHDVKENVSRPFSLYEQNAFTSESIWLVFAKERTFRRSNRQNSALRIRR